MSATVAHLVGLSESVGSHHTYPERVIVITCPGTQPWAPVLRQPEKVVPWDIAKGIGFIPIDDADI